jgi:hypothetical protein
LTRSTARVSADTRTLQPRIPIGPWRRTEVTPCEPTTDSGPAGCGGRGHSASLRVTHWGAIGSAAFCPDRTPTPRAPGRFLGAIQVGHRHHEATAPALRPRSGTVGGLHPRGREFESEPGPAPQGVRSSGVTVCSSNCASRPGSPNHSFLRRIPVRSTTKVRGRCQMRP